MRIDRLPEHVPLTEDQQADAGLESEVVTLNSAPRGLSGIWSLSALAVPGLVLSGLLVGWTLGAARGNTSVVIPSGQTPGKLEWNLVIDLGGEPGPDDGAGVGSNTCPVEPEPEPGTEEPEPEPKPAVAEARKPADPYACPRPDPARDSRSGKPISWLAERCPITDEGDIDEQAAHESCLPGGDPYGDPNGDDDRGQIRGVAASATRHGVLAVWTRDTIFVSRDDGRSFERTLDGPGPVNAVQVDCHGRVIALRGRASLGIAERRSQGFRPLEFATFPDMDDSLASYETRRFLSAVGTSAGSAASVTRDHCTWRCLATWGTAGRSSP